jgi:hypothetical protein
MKTKIKIKLNKGGVHVRRGTQESGWGLDYSFIDRITEKSTDDLMREFKYKRQLTRGF